MSLQLRRGTNAERLTMTPAVGEAIYTTDTKKIWVGDGSTVGGIEVGTTPPVDSVAGKTGAVTLVKADVTDFVETDYATGAEGDLATTATQPGDNISSLTNDSGFTNDQTGAEIKVAYEAELDTNAFTDANVVTLGTALQDLTAESIKDLSDVFSSMTPTDGQVLTFDTVNGWQAETQAAIPSAFTDLTDTVAYTGASLQLVRVNAGETALEYVAAGTPTLPTTTKGDVIVHNGTTDVRLGVGTDAQILTADSTQASGVKWADAAGGGGVDWGVYSDTITTAPVATGQYSLAIGDGATTNGEWDSVAIGRTATATGGRSVALGSLASCSAYYDTVAIGKSAIAGNGGTTVGGNAKSGTQGISIGKNAVSNGNYNILIGYNISGLTGCDNGVAVGRQSSITGTNKDYFTAVGTSSKSGANGTAVGAYAYAGDRCVSIGNDASNYQTAFTDSVAVGNGVPTSASNQLRIGTSSTVYVEYESGKLSLVGTNAQFVIPPYATVSRPAGPVTGSHVFDTTLGKPIWYDGTNWVDATGTTV